MLQRMSASTTLTINNDITTLICAEKQTNTTVKLTEYYFPLKYRVWKKHTVVVGMHSGFIVCILI